MTNQIPSWAKIGAKVVLTKQGENEMQAIVDNCRSNGETVDEVFPQSGKVYTLREVFHINFVAAIRLNEIVNREENYIKMGKMELAFKLEHFRPVKTRTLEQDVAIFAPLLETKSEKELVDG